MRVLIVSQYFWPERFRVNDVAAALVERGHEVTVLTGQPNYETGSFAEGYSAFAPRSESIDGVAVHRFPLVARGGGTGARLALNYLSFALSSAVLAPLRLREHFDVALVYQMSPVTMALPAFVLNRLRRLPVVFWVQDLWPETLRATGKVTSPRVLATLTRAVAAMYRRSSQVLLESEGFAPAVLAAGVDPHRIVFVPDWAERVYAPCQVEPEAPERKEMPLGFRVMFAGNIGVAQAVGTIVAAADTLRHRRDIKWVMVGDGRRRGWAEDEVRRLRLDEAVTFLGRRPVEAMPRYLSLADSLLLTLQRDPVFALTLPGKLQAYLACGRPVIASADGETARVVGESGGGVACPAEDPGGLAEAVLRMAGTTAAERAEMGKRGRAYFEANFEREMLVTRLESCLVGASEDGRGGAARP